MKQKVIATYESTPYTSRAFKASSPLRLEAISALFGFKGKALGSCRVLELGCSFGANIIYAALNAPSAEFVGIDISPVHIQKAQKIAKDIGAKNLEFSLLKVQKVPRLAQRHCCKNARLKAIKCD